MASLQDRLYAEQPTGCSSPAMSVSDLSVDASDEDWKGRYECMKALLEETRKELDEFQQSSQDLENELEAEIKRTEEAQETLLGQVNALEKDNKEWKRRYKQAVDNATRWETEYEKVNGQLGEVSGKVINLEMNNDDLERAQRAAAAGLQYKDEEVERLILERDEFTEELSGKEILEQEVQRLRVELQEMKEEVSILQTRLFSAGSATCLFSHSPVISLDSSASTYSDASESNPSIVEPSTPREAAAYTPSIAPTKASASTTTKSRFLGLIRRPSTIDRDGDTRSSSPCISRPVHPDIVLRERESRGLRLVSDMRARTRALQAKIGAVNLPRVSRVESLAASTSKLGARARQSLGSSIKPRVKKLHSALDSESSARQSMDTRLSLHTKAIPLPTGSRTSTDSTASGWDSLSDVVTATSSSINITPRAPRTRQQSITVQKSDTIRPARKTPPRPLVGKMTFNLSPVPESLSGRPGQSGRASRGGMTLKHKRSATLDRLGESLINGWRPSTFGIGSRISRLSTNGADGADGGPLSPPSAASVSGGFTGGSASEVQSSSAIPQPIVKVSHKYSGLSASSTTPSGTMTTIKTARRSSGAGRDDIKGRDVVKAGGSPGKIPQRKTSRTSGTRLAL